MKKYITYDGYYKTGDAGYFDEDGYLHVMTRLDDVNYLIMEKNAMFVYRLLIHVDIDYQQLRWKKSYCSIKLLMKFKISIILIY